MAKKEKQVLEKKNWRSNFQLVGEIRVNDNTFKIDEHSAKSDWIYNRLNLGVNCGEKYGTVYCEAMGGYGANRDNVILTHGKDADGNDDYKEKVSIAWEDRMDKDVLDTVGNGAFFRASIEKTADGKLFTQRFIHLYDFIKYCKEHLTDGMAVDVRGNLRYQIYKDEVTVRREITSIRVIEKAPEKYTAIFVQTMLVGKDCLVNVDKKTGLADVDGVVLEYFKEFNGCEVRGNVPLHKSFTFQFPMAKPEMWKTIKERLFTVRKGYNEVRWAGAFIESGTVAQLTEDDLSDDVKVMIECGIYTLEEALQNTAVSGGTLHRMMLTKPATKTVETEFGGNKQELDIIYNRYNEEDLELECLVAKEEVEEEDFPMNKPVLEEEDDLDFLNDI